MLKARELGGGIFELDRRVSVTMPKYASPVSYNICQVAFFETDYYLQLFSKGKSLQSQIEINRPITQIFKSLFFCQGQFVFPKSIGIHISYEIMMTQFSKVPESMLSLTNYAKKT